MNHERNDNFKEFARGDVLIRVGYNDYSAKIIVGFTTGNQMVLYDIVNFTPTHFDIKKEDSSIDFGKSRNLRNEPSSVDPTIPQEQSGVNTSIFENAENDTKNSQLSLSKQGEQSTVGTPLQDLYHEDDIAPVKETAESKGELASRKSALTELYNGINADIDAELTADLIGDYLFSDSAFVNKLTGNRNLFQKVWDEIKYLCKVATGKQLTQIEKVEREFARAWKEYGNKPVQTDKKADGVKFSFGVTQDDINDYVDKAYENNNTEEHIIYAEPDARLVVDVANEIDITNYAHALRDNDIRHIRNSHGEQTPEKYPVTKDDIKQIPNIVQNYDKVLVAKKGNKIGIVYVKVAPNGLVYYLEQVTSRYKNEDLLINKQMIKTGIGDIPDILGIKDAIKKKQTESDFLADLKVRQVYAQSVNHKQSAFNDSISQNSEKSSENENFSTDSKETDATFSLSNTVEEAKNLVALHNLTSDKLSRTMDLGGFPMPSIAVTRMDIPHTNFGDITLVMNRSTIDPKTNRKNTVYSADAWTPTVPPTQYKPNDSRLREISKKVYGLVGDRNVANALDHVAFDSDNVSSDLNRNDGKLANKYLNNDTMKYAFLKDIGADIEMPMKEAKLHRNVSNEAVRYFSGKLVNGLQTVEHYQNMSSTDMMNDKELAEAVAEALNWDVLRQFEEGSENYEMLKANPLYKADDLSFSQIDGLLSGARRLLNYGVEQTIDGREASNIIRNHFNENNLQEQYESWLNDLFEGVVEKTGIYNNKDIFTPSGNRRTFDQLHMPVTLDNIVKAMASQNGGNTKNVAGFNGVKTLRAGMAERFKSIDDMHKLEGRLQHLTEEEFDAIHDQLSERMNDIINRIIDTGVPSSGNIYMRMDSVGEILMEIAESRKYTTDYIQKAVNQYSYNVDESLAEDIRTLLYDVSQMPTNMFEAKPERAVGFDEVNAAILPNDVDKALRERLEGMGVRVLTYEAGNDTDRLNILNSLLEEQPDWRFSLSSKNEAPSTTGTPLKDLYYEDDIAPVKDVPKPNTQSTDNIAPAQVISKNSTTENYLGNEQSTTPKSTKIANGTRSDELLNQSLDNYPIQTVEQKIAEKTRAVEGELADNMDLRKEAEANYDNKIAKLREKYASKKNKDTKEANKILQSISRLERLKASADADYAKRISDLEARIERLNEPKYSRAMQKQAKMKENAKWAADLLGDTSTWVDKKLGLQYATNTERRNLRDIVRDKNGNADIARADAIDVALNGQYNREEAKKKKELAEARQKYADLKITEAEDEYIQMLGELRHNPDTTLTEKVVTSYYVRLLNAEEYVKAIINKVGFSKPNDVKTALLGVKHNCPDDLYRKILEKMK